VGSTLSADPDAACTASSSYGWRLHLVNPARQFDVKPEPIEWVAVPSLARPCAGCVSSGILTDDGKRPMTAFNAVRFRVKPARDQEFLDAHKSVEASWPGLRHANIIKRQ
jgi:hypothetical protein